MPTPGKSLRMKRVVWHLKGLQVRHWRFFKAPPAAAPCPTADISVYATVRVQLTRLGEQLELCSLQRGRCKLTTVLRAEQAGGRRQQRVEASVVVGKHHEN